VTNSQLRSHVRTLSIHECFALSEHTDTYHHKLGITALRILTEQLLSLREPGVVLTIYVNNFRYLIEATTLNIKHAKALSVELTEQWRNWVN